jgi:DNA-binding CsgD family transcriptional regulator
MKKIILDSNTVKEILEKYKSGKNIHIIQAETHLGRRHIKNALKEAGLSVLTKSELIRDSIPELKNKELLILLHFKQNLSLLDIAIKFKTNEQVIKTAFKLLKIKPKTSLNSKKDKFLQKHPLLSNKDDIYKLYITDKKSSKSIAETIGCSHDSITRALKKHKIKLRNHPEASILLRGTLEEKINAKIARNIRTRFWIALNGKSKMASAVNDLGCSILEFRKNLELKFHPNPNDQRPMTWDNYGQWEIDHIKPLSSYDLANAQEQKDACHHTNLAPEWQKANRQKSDKLPSTLPNRVKFYIIAGPAGSGKSWICDQLTDVNYISYDSIPKEQHYHYMVEMSKNGKPIVYDPFRKVSTIYNRYKSVFDMKIVLIEEAADVVYVNLKNRGSNLSMEKVLKGCKHSLRYRKNAYFSGTSQEVLEFLQKDLLSCNPANGGTIELCHC